MRIERARPAAALLHSGRIHSLQGPLCARGAGRRAEGGVPTSAPRTKATRSVKRGEKEGRSGEGRRECPVTTGGRAAWGPRSQQPARLPFQPCAQSRSHCLPRGRAESLRHRLRAQTPSRKEGEKSLWRLSQQPVVLLTAARADQPGTGTEGRRRQPGRTSRLPGGPLLARDRASPKALARTKPTSETRDGVRNQRPVRRRASREAGSAESAAAAARTGLGRSRPRPWTRTSRRDGSEGRCAACSSSKLPAPPARRPHRSRKGVKTQRSRRRRRRTGSRRRAKSCTSPTRRRTLCVGPDTKPERLGRPQHGGSRRNLLEKDHQTSP